MSQESELRNLNTTCSPGKTNQNKINSKIRKKMSMIAKTEKNLASNLPVSKSNLSIKSIIKDLQDLDKNLITKNELEVMKAKMTMLEEENSRLKAGLQATEADRKLYYNQFHQNVKEVCDLKTENESLKAEISSLKMTEQSNIEEIACSSFQSAIPVNNTGSEDGREQEIQDVVPTLAIEDRIDDVASAEPSGLDQATSSNSKRPSKNDISTEPEKKKTKIQPIEIIKLWKCTTEPCTGNRFDTIEHLRSHIVECHPDRKFMCNRCPFSTKDRWNMKEHAQKHVTADLKCNGVEGAKQCSLCNIYFRTGSAKTHHNKKYH